MGTNGQEMVWEMVLASLRRLRGRNSFRGREEQLRPLGEFRLHPEWRAGEKANGFVRILVGESLEELRAEEVPAGKTWNLKTFEGDLDAWLLELLAHCKGAPYLHTRSAKADYRVRSHSMEQSDL